MRDSADKYIYIYMQDVESSSAAMKSLQGTLLPTSDRGGLHLEYPSFVSMLLYVISILR